MWEVIFLDLRRQPGSLPGSGQGNMQVGKNDGQNTGRHLPIKLVLRDPGTTQTTRLIGSWDVQAGAPDTRTGLDGNF